MEIGNIFGDFHVEICMDNMLHQEGGGSRICPNTYVILIFSLKGGRDMSKETLLTKCHNLIKKPMPISELVKG